MKNSFNKAASPKLMPPVCLCLAHTKPQAWALPAFKHDVYRFESRSAALTAAIMRSKAESGLEEKDEARALALSEKHLLIPVAKENTGVDADSVEYLHQVKAHFPAHYRTFNQPLVEAFHHMSRLVLVTPAVNMFFW